VYNIVGEDTCIAYIVYVEGYAVRLSIRWDQPETVRAEDFASAHSKFKTLKGWLYGLLQPHTTCYTRECILKLAIWS
jgi:hypothetical protein